jgi:peptidoglycan hydrolase-like protein with peptidoglycan-binding domain
MAATSVGGPPIPVPVVVAGIALAVLALFPSLRSGPEPVTVVGPSQAVEADAPADRPVLRLGDRGPSVTTVQELLVAAGYDPGPVDGLFGEQTRTAVEAFQQVGGLTSDGVVGIETWEALEHPSTR